MSARYADKDILKKLNDEATRLNYNRTLYPEAIDKLPDDEIFAVVPLMIHEHAQGVPVDPHLRCRLTSATGQTNMDFVLLDIPMYLFELLPERTAAQTSG
jgi:hypothetical protein